MSNLVGAVKAYAYVDRGGLVETDLHEGLESTLAVMGHKLKHTHRPMSCSRTSASFYFDESAESVASLLVGPRTPDHLTCD